MGRKPGLVVAVVVAGLTLFGSGSAKGRAASYRRLTGEGDEATSVRGAVEGARKRLAQEGCARVLEDFADASGRTLRASLDALSLTPSEYIDRLVFYDAEGAGRCGSTGVLAMTTPGSRAVVVCAAPFAAARRRDRRLTEVILIHETLHSLGLGENPPSASEITSRVLARCGH